MAKPTENYDWATNANYAGGPDVGTASKVEPTAGVRADGWRKNDQPPAQYQNWWQNTIQKWAEYFEDVIDATRDTNGISRQIDVPASAFTQLSSAGVFQWGLFNTAAVLQSAVNTGVTAVGLARYMPHGGILTGVQVLVNPGVARATVGNRAQTLDWVTPASPGLVTIGADQTDNGTTNIQVVAWGTLSLALTSAQAIVLEVTAGNDAGTNTDSVHGVRLTFTDPGPRNF
jgi:hypothetical protein